MAYSDPNFIYPDIQIEVGDQTFDYTKEGPKCKRKFIINNIDMSDPSSTLQNLYASIASDTPGPMDLPSRGSQHPTITYTSPWDSTNAFCADNINIKAITSTQAEVEVDYCIFNGEIQEPDSDSLALLICSASVQTIQTSVDNYGNTLIVPYVSAVGTSPSNNLYTISGIDPTQTTFAPFLPGNPQFKVTSQIQVPNTLFRFIRREPTMRDPTGIVGSVNYSGAGWDLTPWPINVDNSNTISDMTALCTRVENKTLDNGQTYIVTYEFQYQTLSTCPTAPNYTYPDGQGFFADPSNGTGPSPIIIKDGKHYLSPWAAVAYYQVNGTGTLSSGTHPPNFPNTVQNGQIPPDAVPAFFLMYPTLDFDATLDLPGDPYS